MKLIAVLLSLLAPVLAGSLAAALSTNTAATNRILIIDRSSTRAGGGKATLTIGRLERTADIYAGTYQVKVSPYFFKSEKGLLAIDVPDKDLAQVTRGIPAQITGTATSAGKGGATRRIEATATPTDHSRGGLTLWFISEGRKMVFNTSYRFLDP